MAASYDGGVPSTIEMLTVSEVAKVLHVHPNTVRNWSDNGLLRAYRLGYRGDRRFSRREIEKFLAGQQI
jgi:excisionase family DNA binding protein